MAVMLVMFACATTATAQSDTVRQPKIITNAKMIGVGTVNILDTYLSPEKYTGSQFLFMSQTMRERNGSRLSRQITHQANVAYTDNRSGDGTEISGMYRFTYAWLYGWKFLAGNLDVRAGGMADGNLGFIYNMRNGNNPAQLRAFLNITPTALVTYKFRMLKRNVALRYQIDVPLVGVMFSPHYGQSYYEIFSEGDYDHNIVATYSGNAPSMRNTLMLDIPIGHITARIGYLGEFNQSKVNSIKTHIYTHALMVGVVKHFQILNIKP